MSSTRTSEIRNRLHVGDARNLLQQLPRNSVDCVVTSPPYFQLRDYEHPSQIGHEPDVHGWVKSLVAVFDEVHRVLKPDGTVWLNLADTYSRHRRQGAQRKSLLFGPERLLLGLAAHGWVVRNKIVWAKTNPMPHSVRDRLSPTWEYIYLLSKTEKGYWFDLDAIRIPHKTQRQRVSANASHWSGSYGGTNTGLTKMKRTGRVGHRLGKNPGDVWQQAKAANRGAHSATFPERLIETPILAGCPPTTCRRCGQPTCDHDNPRVPGLVLDPFMGTGTTARVAQRLGRDWVGIDLTNKHFVAPKPANREAA